MLKQTIDLFQKSQHMDDPEYEIYNYSDAEIPKIFPHKHIFYEIFYLLCDQVDYFIGSQIYHVKKGDLLLIPPGMLHYPSDIQPDHNNHYSRMVIWCDVEFFESFTKIDSNINQMWPTIIANRAFHIHPSAGSSSHLLALLIRLFNERNGNEFAARGMCYSILLEILVLINRIIQNTTNFEKCTPTAKLFDNIIYYIHAHLTEDLSLDSLSEQFFISKGYISRLFREYMGVPVHQYILSLRLEGCRKAIKTGASITSVADLYGFQDYSNFYRAFKSAFSISPKEYQHRILSANTEIEERL